MPSPLFFSADPPSPAEREALIRIWYRVNVLRITAGALLAAYRASKAPGIGIPIAACDAHATGRNQGS